MTRPGVVGLGLVGGSLLQGLGAAGCDPVGWDADARVGGAAARAGFAVADDAAALARACDVVFVCVPPGATAAAVAELLAADQGVVVADAASVKAPVVTAVAARVGEEALRRYVPAHPLAGSERAGWEAADATLLRDAPWAVCAPSPRYVAPAEQRVASAEAPAPPVEPLCSVSAALDPLGARLLVCDATAHDEALARTSHAPHLVAQALARASGGGLAAALTGGAFRDMTRTAGADPDLWTAILLANRVPSAAALRSVGRELSALADALEAGDAAALRDAWRMGAAARDRALGLRWGDPDWEPARLDWPAWDALLALGQEGRAVRRLRWADGALELQIARASMP